MGDEEADPDGSEVVVFWKGEISVPFPPEGRRGG